MHCALRAFGGLWGSANQLKLPVQVVLRILQQPVGEAARLHQNSFVMLSGLDEPEYSWKRGCGVIDALFTNLFKRNISAWPTSARFLAQSDAPKDHSLLM